jgi:hypothetical protein
MKHAVTYLNDTNDPMMFNHSHLGNYNYDSFFGNHTVEISLHAKSFTQSKIHHFTQIVEPKFDIVDLTNTNSDVQTNIVSRSKLDVYVNSSNPNKLENKTNHESQTKSKGGINMWNLFFDGCKSLEGVGDGSILKYPSGRRTLIACRVEF